MAIKEVIFESEKFPKPRSKKGDIDTSKQVQDLMLKAEEALKSTGKEIEALRGIGFALMAVAIAIKDNHYFQEGIDE
ncbi:MAG: hypothetical protein WCT07_04245 [Candidatus Paceibacterota bacterium]